jgi:uncharacterized membrane protein YcgQ (UPF0703/DUF1980 family)
MKISIVGNSRCILKTDNQDNIDSSDLVIRFNNFKIKNYEKHCGTKIDFVSIMVSSIDSTLFETVTPFHLKSAKKILFPFKVSNDQERLTNTIRKCTEYFFLNDSSEFELIDQTLIENLTEKLKYYSERNGIKRETYNPSSGMSVIEYCLEKYPNDEISLYGFDPFKFEEYYANYWEPNLVLDNGTSHPLVAEGILIENYRRQNKLVVK